MSRLLAIFVALLAAWFSACSPAEPEIGGVKLKDFPGLGEPPLVKLIKAGEGERSELRYRFSAGSTHELVMTMRISNPQTPAIKTPTTRFVLMVEILEADEERAQIEFTIPNDPELFETEGVPPEIIEQIEKGLRGMSSFRGRTTTTNRGVTEEGDFQVDEGDRQLAQFLESMKQSMSQMSTPLPVEPVGVGAQWKTFQKLVGVMTMYQVSSFELLRRDGPSLTLGITLEQLTPEQDMSLPAAPPGVKVELVGGKGKGRGDITWDLRSPVPRSSLSLESETTMRIHAEGKVQETTMHMDMHVEVEPGATRHAVAAGEGPPGVR